jgi:hypothetical protein
MQNGYTNNLPIGCINDSLFGCKMDILIIFQLGVLITSYSDAIMDILITYQLDTVIISLLGAKRIR